MRHPALHSSLFAVLASTLFLPLGLARGAPDPAHTPGELVDALHTAFGAHHARAVHAKGIILEGTFKPAPTAASLTTAFHLQATPSKVVLRFSDFTGIPNISDTEGGASPRGLAIKFTAGDGASTDIVGHSFNGFPTPTSDQFRELLLAIGASGPGAAKPTELDRFLDSHPVAKKFLSTQKMPASYATISYYGVNAFKFTNKAGASSFVRYQFLPEAGEQVMTPEALAKAGPDYLQDEVKGRVKQGQLRFTLYAQVAGAGDDLEDPSVAWPDTRTRVLLGTIELTAMGSNTTQQDRALLFLPTNVPTGIEPADPMLRFRASAYPISFKGRQ